MSDSFKRLTGLFLTVFSIILCCIPSITGSTGNRFTFISEKERYIKISSIQNISQGSIHVNTADSEQLKDLPGIGETKSSLIIEERNANGLFYYPEDLESVRGIGPVLIKKIRDMINLKVHEGEE